MLHSRLSLVLLPLGIAVLGIVAIFVLLQRNPAGEISYPLSFDGRSDRLSRTVILPTLDSPIPKGKSAIWCASFQMAWNKLKSEVAKGPIQVSGGEETANRLN